MRSRKDSNRILCRTCSRTRSIPVSYGDFYSILQFVEPGHRKHIAGLNSLHRRSVAIGGPYRDVLDRGRLIRLDQIHKCVLRIPLNRRSRNQRGVLLRIHQQPRIDKLIRK
jgi:hypothetical protein